jgi:hypothetical protein
MPSRKPDFTAGLMPKIVAIMIINNIATAINTIFLFIVSTFGIH